MVAWCLAWQGDCLPARAHVNDAVAIAEEAQHPPSIASAYLGAGLTYLLQGDVESAIPALERSLALYTSLHFRTAAAPSFLAWAYALAGRLDEAPPLFERSLEMAAAMKFLPCNSIWIVWWGETCLRAGKPDEAMDHAVRALELARAQKEPAYEAYALHLRSEIVARRDPLDMERAETGYRQAIALAERLGLRPLLARCQLGLGTLFRRSGDRPRAADCLTAAADMLREMDMRLWLARAATELAALEASARS
jgi:tetratricopeptide (TPR) repeat protein